MIRQSWTVAMLIVLLGAAYLVGDQRAAPTSASAHRASKPSAVRTLDTHQTSCGRDEISAQVSGARYPMGLLACSATIRIKYPPVLTVRPGQTVSITGLTVTRPAGQLSTNNPALLSVDTAHDTVTALAVGRARLLLRSVLCQEAGNPCTLAILDIS